MTTFINPVLTGALLFALTAAPNEVRDPVVQHLSQYLSAENIARLTTGLKFAVGYGVLNRASIWFSELAQNNFRLSSEKHRYNWPSEVAVVTGACGGVGSLIAKGLAAKGIKVACLDIRDDLPEDMKAEKFGQGKLYYYKCDITSREAVFEVQARIVKDLGHPSILVNNAGVANAAPIMKVTEKMVRQLFDVNIVSHYFLIQAFMPNMIKENKGHIFATASVASFMAAPGLVPYSNTKAAVLALHEGLGFETRAISKAPAIKFSIIHPTFIDTAMAAPFKSNLKDAGAGIITPESVANNAVKQILSCRSGQIILSGNLGNLVNVRKWPKWLYYGIFYIGDRRTLKMAPKEFLDDGVKN